MSKNIKSYIIQTYQNQDKNNTINVLYNEYKNYYKFQVTQQYRLYQQTGFLNKSRETKKDKSLLSERYKRCVVYQVCGQLQSWLSNRDNKIKEIIHNCESLTSNEKRILHIIRKNPQDFTERKISILNKKTNEIKEEIFISKE